MEKVELKLKEINRNYLEKSKRYDEYYEQYQNAAQDILTKRQVQNYFVVDFESSHFLFQALDAFHEAVTMFDEHIELHKSVQDSAFPHEKRSLKDNFEIIHKRLKMLHEKQEELARDLRKVNAYNRNLDVEMNSLKPEIIQLYKQREQHQAWLFSHGSRVEDINRLLVQSSRELPHNDQETWLMNDIDRPTAEAMLINQVGRGTFVFFKPCIMTSRCMVLS